MNSVKDLGSSSAAACLAAVLLIYESDSGEMVSKLKEIMIHISLSLENISPLIYEESGQEEKG